MKASPETSTRTAGACITLPPSATSDPSSLGPNLQPLGGFRRRTFILAYAWRQHRVQILIMSVATLVLLCGVYAWEVLRLPLPHLPPVAASMAPANWAEWVSRLQSFLGVGTLLVALFVWYGEIRDDWEGDLPNQMSVFFFHGGRPAIVCRHVWLAGADDLRAWGQQVAAQAVGERFLDFSPQIEAHGPVLALTPSGTVCRHYVVRFQLTKLPSSLAGDSNVCRYQNLVAADPAVRNAPAAAVAALSEVAAWPRTSC